MHFFRKKPKKIIPPPQWKITDNCFSLIAESAKSMYPKEFGGLLRCDEELKDTISEVVLLPGTIAGDSHAIFRMHMKPFDLSIVGTVHSHPSTAFYPSNADKQLFSKYGRVHIIIASPYTKDSWGAYNGRGGSITVHII